VHPGSRQKMKDSSLQLHLSRRCRMKKNHEDEIDFFEGELNLCHALLDIAGPKHLTGLIAKARLGYENAMLWIGTVRDPIKLSRITTKLDRLRQRLSRYSTEPQSAAAGVAIKAGL
jgi:hypothetical protein